jgi:hypothetical protein
MNYDAEKPGEANGKVADSDIQGVKGGKRNRAATEKGVMPPPAGEPAAARSKDPRRGTGVQDGGN